jgi:hypothetical protein
MSGQRPGPVTGAVWATAGLVLLSGVAAVLTIVLHDDLVRSWAEGHRDLRELLRTQGLDAVKDGPVTPPAFVPVAIVLFVVLACLAAVLVALFLARHPWARIALTALVVFVAVGTLAGLRTSPPASFLVLSIASLVLDAVVLVCLWHPSTGAYLRGSWAAPARAGAPLPR